MLHKGPISPMVLEYSKSSELAQVVLYIVIRDQSRSADRFILVRAQKMDTRRVNGVDLIFHRNLLLCVMECVFVCVCVCVHAYACAPVYV